MNNEPVHHPSFEQLHREELLPLPWEELLPRLELYALNKTRRLYWLGKLSGDLPGGDQAEDLVLKAVEKVYKGERHWNQQAQPNFYKFLEGVVDSLISHLMTSVENRRGISLVSNDADQDPIYQIRANDDSPETKLIQAGSEDMREQIFGEFQASLVDDLLAQRYLVCIYNNPTNLKPAAIAKQMGVSIDEIYNLKKRLKRRLSDYLNSLQLIVHQQNQKR